MREATVSKVVMLMLSLGVMIGPIVFAFEQSEWDVSALFTPVYSPPKIDFSINMEDVRIENGDLHVICELKNLGEIKMVWDGVNASAYGPDGEKIAPVNLTELVVSVPQSKKTFVMNVNLDNSVLSRLSSYFIDEDRVHVEIKGEADMRVLGSTVTAPVQFSFFITTEDLGMPAHYEG